MKLSDLHFSYPEELVATEPVKPSRVLWVHGSEMQEISLSQLLHRIPPGDALVINNTKVLKRRIFVGDLEILFLSSQGQQGLEWQVLFPSKKFSVGDIIDLPRGVKMTLLSKGRPQTVKVEPALTEEYFEEVAELPLPPYIQKARGKRHTVSQDESWYQTDWAQKAGSFAAPTASLHFSKADIEYLQRRGVKICEVTLHVGLGTFLPVSVEDLDQHEMHEEYFEVAAETWREIQNVKAGGQKIWALGTTAARTLESVSGQRLWGTTRLLIQPGFQWKIVDCLMTNFHQPESTLLALVAGFSDLATLKAAYQFAIGRKFRLFSYGDLSVWTKPTVF